MISCGWAIDCSGDRAQWGEVLVVLLADYPPALLRPPVQRRVVAAEARDPHEIRPGVLVDAVQRPRDLLPGPGRPELAPGGEEAAELPAQPVADWRRQRQPRDLPLAVQRGE